jgi:protein SDA1
MVTALQFFLGNNEDDEDSEDEDELPDIRSLQHKQNITKKTKSKAKQMEKTLATLKRKQKAKKKAETFNFSALHLLNDPQGKKKKKRPDWNVACHSNKQRHVGAKIYSSSVGGYC